MNKSSAEMKSHGMIEYLGIPFVEITLRKATTCVKCKLDIADGEKAFRPLRESKSLKRYVRLCQSCGV